MKKIFLVCNYFAPDNAIAAVRTTKFAKYFRKNGYEVTVLAEQHEGILQDNILEKDAQGIEIIRINNTRKAKVVISLYDKLISPIKNKRLNNLDNRMRINKKTGKYEFYPFQVAYPFLGSLDYLVELFRQYNLFKQAKKHLNNRQDISYFFTSYGDYFSYYVGKYLKKKYQNIPWIFDIRDSIYQYKFTPKYIKWIPCKITKYVARKADCIIGASKGICMHIPKKYWNKVHCVTNGYDENDRIGIYGDKTEPDKLEFAYTGAMYGGIRNLSPFFGALKKMIEEGIISKEKIKIYYAGKESAYQIFRDQAEGHSLGDTCVYCGQVSRNEALKIQMSVDILLVSSNDYQTGTNGMITGKALEYMSADKPIVVIVNGDVEKSELADIIRAGNLGFAYQEITGAKDSIGLYHFLCEKYHEKIKCGKMSHNPYKKILRKYDYRYICKRLLTIIESM